MKEQITDINQLIENILQVRIIKVNEEEKFVLAAGIKRASINTFDTEEEAEEYRKEPHWDTAIAVLEEIIKFNEMKKEK